MTPCRLDSRHKDGGRKRYLHVEERVVMSRMHVSLASSDVSFLF